jgi:hypothetical protein
MGGTFPVIAFQEPRELSDDHRRIREPAALKIRSALTTLRMSAEQSKTTVEPQ